MQAPDDAPAAKTLVASAWFCMTTYATIFVMASRSPLRAGVASKQLPPAPGAMMMKPYLSA
ncbi:MAG: hypothetical protein WDO69_06755 [Pseudomonadota bacterium]